MNRREICDDRFVTKVKHNQESSVKPIQLSDVREDIFISVDVAEPAAVKRELCLAQRVKEAVLSQNRTRVTLLNLGEKN